MSYVPGIPMSTFTATFLLETGDLRTLHIMAPTAHEARRIVASWIGKKHPDAIALVSLGALDRGPRHRAETRTAHAALLAAMLTAGALLLLLIFALLHH